MTSTPWFGTPNDGATCSVTLGSPTVTIAGSNLVTGGGSDPGFVGQAFLGPDGSQYEVLTVDSTTQLTLRSNYRGATVVSAGFFQIVPVQGFSRDAAYKLSQFIALISAGSSVISKFGIGMVPVNVLDISQSINGGAIASILNNSSGTAAFSEFICNNATSAVILRQYGSGFTTAGVERQNGGIILATGAGGLTVGTNFSQPIYFGINSAEVARFDTSGNLLVGITASAPYLAHVLSTGISGAEALAVLQSHASNPFGYYVKYTGAAPNGTGNDFLLCVDNAATRATIRSNGGLANFSANNVNLSDISVKPEFAQHTDVELDALQASFVAVDWGRFKYADQTHDDWNYGYSAQGVEAAFALSVPAMTDVWNLTTTVEVDDGTGKMIQSKIPTPVKDQLKAVYTEDLHNIAHALLARALTRIATLEARLAAAGIA